MQLPTLTYSIRANLYLNITDRCTLRCHFCPKHNGSQRLHGYDLALQYRPTTQEVIDAIGDPRKYQEIVFCGYGEPTLRLKELLTIAEYLKTCNSTVRINTDGLANLVHKRNVLPEMAGLIDALSVSMNASDHVVYVRHCQPALPGAFNAMLAFLEKAPRYIPDVTATAIDGLQGVDIEACAKLAAGLGVKFRCRNLDVVG